MLKTEKEKNYMDNNQILKSLYVGISIQIIYPGITLYPLILYRLLSQKIDLVYSV